MSRIFPALIVCWAAVGTPEVVRGDPPAVPQFVIGVVPFLSTRPLIQCYQPLAEYLAYELERPVVIETAADVRAFHQRGTAGEFDLIVTYAHLARLGQLDAGWQPLATYLPRLHGMIIVPRTSPIKQLDDLRGHRIAQPPRPGLVPAVVLRRLEERGLRAGRDLILVNSAAADAIVLAMLSGESDAAVVTVTRLAELPESQRAQVRVLAKFGEAPGMIIAAGARIAPAEAARLQQLLVAIAPGTETARRFLAPQRYENIQVVDAPAMKALDPYLPDARRSLEGQP